MTDASPSGRVEGRRARRVRLLVVPLLSVAGLAAVVLVAHVTRPEGTSTILGVELGMRADEVMRAWEPSRGGSWQVGRGLDTAVTWQGRGDARRVEPARARFEFHASRLAAVRVTFPPGTPLTGIVERVRLEPVAARRGARVWDRPGSFCILMEEADGNRSIFLLDAASPRYEGEIEMLRRVQRLGR